MPLILTFAGLNDYKLLSDLGATCFSEAFAQYNDPEDLKKYLAKAFDAEKIKTELQDKELTYLLAYDEQEAIGYAKLNRKEIPDELKGFDTIQLERIYVRQKVKGKKVGASLMQKCIEIAKGENKKIIWLGVWQENKIAIDFYNKWGFGIFGVKKFIIGDKVDDDYMMKKKLV